MSGLGPDATAAPSESTPQRRRRVPSLPTLLVSLACFFLIFEFLAYQLGSGRDPVIGASDAHQAASRPRPVVIHRRIIVRRVVDEGSGALIASGAGSSTTSSAGTTAAAPVAPAPVAAPAPAPVTSSS